MNLNKVGFLLHGDALRIDNGRQDNYPKNHSLICRRGPGRSYGSQKRLATYCDLPGSDPEFDAVRFETASVEGDQDCIDRSREAEAEIRPHLRFRLPPVLEFTPPRGTSTLKNLIGPASDGLLDSRSLCSGIDLAGADCVFLRRRCVCSHSVLHAFLS